MVGVLTAVSTLAINQFILIATSKTTSFGLKVEFSDHKVPPRPQERTTLAKTHQEQPKTPLSALVGHPEAVTLLCN